MQEQVARPDTHQYPSNRGRASFREAVAGFYARRFGVEVDPETEVIPALGAKEAIANLNLALLDPGDVALASDPGYPVYTTGPLRAGAEPVPLPLVPELGFQPDLDAVPAEVAARARLMFLNYPNNPTGAIVPHGFLERVLEFAPELDVPAGVLPSQDLFVAVSTALLTRLERSGHTLVTTDIVHEVYLKLAAQRNVQWGGADRGQFFARAARSYLDQIASRSLTQQIDEALQTTDDDSNAAAAAAGRSYLAGQDDW